jgi:predicted ATP-dependent endonuclease of OLD family
MQDRQDRAQGPAYFYVGMKNARHGQSPDKASPPKTPTDLVNDLVRSFQSCLSQPTKRERWLRAIKRLESDINFAEMDLGGLMQNDDYETTRRIGALAGRMSSGHSIVLLTITKLVDTVEEKTLVLLDEPESHLHPPLLSAFTRALSDLLHNRNGVAVIATHSPVVLQEVPRSCVLILSRTRAEARADRPERETFGENVGILTREVFGLEVSKSGFTNCCSNQ